MTGAALALAVAGLAAAAPAGCAGSESGTIALGLTTAPGSTLLDRVVRLRLTFTNPAQVILLDRTERGFDLALDLEASDTVRALVVDGLDEGAALVATGMTPPFPLNAQNSRIVVYMAVPMSVGAAPVALEPARARPSTAALSYGVVLAGGVEAGAPSDAVQIYNAYDHSLVTGLPMSDCPATSSTPPGPREGVTLARTANNRVFLFGGTAPGGAPTGTLCLFDTNVIPAGRYIRSEDFPEFPRTGSAAVPIGGDRFLITGPPSLQLAAAQISEPEGIAAISSGASVTAADQVTTTTILVDDATGDLLRLRGGALDPLGAQRKGGVAVALPGRRIAVIGGAAAPRDAVIIDPATGGLTPVPGALSEAYATLAVAATPRFVVVAGGRAGGAGTQIEILDAATLERRHATSVGDAITAAIALPNEQVLLIGAALQLFTPPSPAE